MLVDGRASAEIQEFLDSNNTFDEYTVVSKSLQFFDVMRFI